MSGLTRTVTLELDFVFGPKQLDAALGQAASSIVRKLLYAAQNHSSCIALRVLAVFALPPREVQLVYAVLGRTAVPVSCSLKSRATQLMPIER